MELLKAEAADCFREGATIEGQQYELLLETINKSVQIRAVFSCVYGMY